jgi:hypothetical protein
MKMTRKIILFVLFAVLIMSGGAYAQKGGNGSKGDKSVKYKRDVIAAKVEWCWYGSRAARL